MGTKEQSTDVITQSRTLCRNASSFTLATLECYLALTTMSTRISVLILISSKIREDQQRVLMGQVPSTTGVEI